jgi:LytS/YehU family sensor histidine kinase
LVELKDIKKSNRYLGKSNRLIRKIFLSGKEQFIELEEEVEMLNLYLDLEKLRLGKGFIIDFKSDISLERQKKIKIPAMFILPYIENAIKQGSTKLKIYFGLKESYLSCIIENFDLENSKKAHLIQKKLQLHTVFSIESNKERMRILNNSSNRNIQLEVVNIFNGKTSIGAKTSLWFPV